MMFKSIQTILIAEIIYLQNTLTIVFMIYREKCIFMIIHFSLFKIIEW